jgi:CheY-like chemotaxis protein
MSIQCLYITTENSKNSVWQPVEQAAPSQLKIVPQPGKPFEEQISLITDNKPDLLIIDLRLDEKNGIGYRGPSLAQELRARMTENTLPSFPIVLCSCSNTLEQTRELDESLHNLFDRIYDKDIANAPQRIASELQSLVKGYHWISEKRTEDDSKFYRMLDLVNEEAKVLTPTIGERFLTAKKYPIQDYARYILKELIDAQGPLINEAVLAARLGVDIQLSKDWPQCQALISQISAYTGAFSEAWPRWWDFKLEFWWDAQPHSPGGLYSLTAEERVDYLQKITGLNKLVAAQPIEKGYSHHYWTICQGLNRPLDPLNAVWASCEGLKDWQEPPRLSFKAASQQIGIERGLKIHPLMVGQVEQRL